MQFSLQIFIFFTISDDHLTLTQHLETSIKNWELHTV